jgi:predicted AAA+ superfamily ATPase
MKTYLPRIVDSLLDFKLRSKGAVWIKGPKWCGKSTTAEQVAKSVIYMQDKTAQAQNIELAKSDPTLFLEGPAPKLIDEWQIIPFIYDQIRFEVDRRDRFGQFIITGSATPPDETEIDHSGTGRIGILVMRPMSLCESKDSTGSVSLGSLFDGIAFSGCVGKNTLSDYAFLTCRGGWPKAIGQEKDIALAQAMDYYDGLVNTDMSEVDQKKRDPERVKLLMRSYGRNIGSQASNTTLKEDMKANDSASLDEDTVLSYVKALKKLYAVEESLAWNPNLRSKTAIRTSDTRYFVDPSLATAALGLGPNDLIGDLKTFGFFFENMAIRDLRVYAEKLGGEVRHYRDASGLECDSVIHLRNGQYGLAEVKLSSPDRIDEGAKNLLTLASEIDSTRMKKPSFLMVVSATEKGYRRPDGVLVVPLGCLKD